MTVSSQRGDWDGVPLRNTARKRTLEQFKSDYKYTKRAKAATYCLINQKHKIVTQSIQLLKKTIYHFACFK